MLGDRKAFCKPLCKDGWKRSDPGTEKDQDGGWHEKRKHIRRDEEESGESRRVEKPAFSSFGGELIVKIYNDV